MPLLSKQLGDRSRSSASEVWYDCGTGVRPSGGLEGESELVDGCYDRERTSLSFKMRCSGSRPFSGVMMGSRMASASRVVQVVKTYTPLRRFPNRREHPKPNVWEVRDQQAFHLTLLQFHSILREVNHQIGWCIRVHQTLEIIKTLPQKYRRKPMSPEEIEFIQHGGPE